MKGNYVYHKMVDFADQLEFELSDLQAGDPAHYFCQETRDKLKQEISHIRECAKMMKKLIICSHLILAKKPF